MTQNQKEKGELKLLWSNEPTEELALLWSRELGRGYFPVDLYWEHNNLREEVVYGADYFHKYENYVQASGGLSINQARVDLVKKYCPGSCGVDVGIGCGTFVSSMPEWGGFDVNPAGVQWLKDQDRFADIYKNPLTDGYEAFTFWDSFEHIKDLTHILHVLPTWVFISLPIFHDEKDALKSKHFRKDEHFHYFTALGLIDMFSEAGYSVLELNDMETKLGREAIKTFVFKRKGP